MCFGYILKDIWISPENSGCPVDIASSLADYKSRSTFIASYVDVVLDDSGLIKGFRILASKIRRISRQSLLRNQTLDACK